MSAIPNAEKEAFALSTGATNNSLEKLRGELKRLIASCTDVEERRIGFGNLRAECSEWHRSEEKITNVAIIYETPGGSTCQINIDYDHAGGRFSFLGPKLEDTIVTFEPADVVAMVNNHIRTIPDRRLRYLHQQIDHWVAEGKTRSQLFAELNKLLQAEFLGGRISTTELRKGIDYALAHYATAV